VSSFLSLDLEEDDKPADYIVLSCDYLRMPTYNSDRRGHWFSYASEIPTIHRYRRPRDIPCKAVHVARLYIVSILLFKRQSADLELSFPCRLERLKSKDRNPSDVLAIPSIEPVRSASTYV
jgi:hypothetical protein